MKKKVLLVILGVVLLVLPLTGCATAVTPKQLAEALDPYALRTDLKGYATAGALSDLGDSIQVQLDEAGAGVVTQEDWDALMEDITSLQTENSTLKSQVAALQRDVADLEGGNGSSSGTTDEEYTSTRWTPTINLEAETTQLYVDQNSVTWRPTRIKDEDTYRITFDIVNATGSDKTKQVLVVYFTPSSRDTTVDTANTGIYSISPINIWWDSDFVPSDGVDCRRMEFVSDPFTVPNGGLEVSFDFDLYYD